MTVDDLVKISDAATKIIGTVVWPMVIVYVLIKYGTSFEKVFTKLTTITLKAGGIEASFEKEKAEASEHLAAAAVAHQGANATPVDTAKSVRAATVAAETVTPRTIRRASGASVLWVDDRPQNNTNERRALEAFGISFAISTSTDDALVKIRNQKFDVIISDMGRPQDSRAGYTLLDELRRSGNNTPYIIYAGSRDPEHVAESKKHGAIGCTNRPDELFNYVLSALND
jgi:CheY-like chemotaxis protein